ncbi:MAG TPA: histidine kinase dimerization/phospho-acceptor domain-containing protein, partial [Gemmatimonadaceae bacterium]|nr:histidine kinase dimerization/phospho-acceptor domain-containing protein [Gemmatimonadaceae bacterium]
MARDVTTTGRGTVWAGESQSTPGERALSLLLISPDDEDRALVRRALSSMTLTADAEELTSADGVIATLRSRPFDGVLLDHQLTGALEVLRELRRLGLDVPVVMLTGPTDPEIAAALMKAGATDFLPKTALAPDQLEATIRTAVRLHRAERALKASQTWASTALRSIGDAVITTDARGFVTYLNRAAEELIGWTSASAVGHPLGEVADVVPDEDGASLEERLKQVLGGHSVISHADMVLRAPGDRRVSVDVRLARIRADRAEGAPTPLAALGSVVVLRDITDRKAAAAALEWSRADAERARAQAESANRAKSEFLATMSHELRTPLNAIGGFTQLMADGIYGPLEPRQSEALRRIKRAQELLLGLINAVLDFAKVQAGRVPLALTDFDVQGVLDDVRALVLPQMLGKALTLDVASIGAEPTMIHADRDKVQQILLNLLSNATKFTARGGRVTLGWEPES